MFSVPEEDEAPPRVSKTVIGSKSTKMLSELSEFSFLEQIKANKSKRRELLSSEAEDSMSEQK